LIETQLRDQLADKLSLVAGSAGLHISALMPAGSDDRALSLKLAARGLHCEALSHYSETAGTISGLAFGYGAIATERIAKGIDILAECLRA
jgi:GntR family transcriptional regulator/MocR family aminotransferase